MQKTILVVGGTSGVGIQVVRKLLQRGEPLRLLARDHAKALGLFGPLPGLCIGDTRQAETLPAALEEVRTVICATGTRTPAGPDSPQHIDYEGVANLVQAAVTAGVEYFVLVSSIGATHPEHPLNAFGQVLTWKKRGEDTLRASGLPYTILRPGGLRDEPGDQFALQFDQGDRISGLISRADVAEACLRALSYPQARGATFELVQSPHSGPASWETLFASLKPDSVNIY